MYPRSRSPELTKPCALSRSRDSETSQPSEFQLFHPICGVRAKPLLTARDASGAKESRTENKIIACRTVGNMSTETAYQYRGKGLGDWQRYNSFLVAFNPLSKQQPLSAPHSFFNSSAPSTAAFTHSVQTCDHGFLEGDSEMGSPLKTWGPALSKLPTAWPDFGPDTRGRTSLPAFKYRRLAICGTDETC